MESAPVLTPQQSGTPAIRGFTLIEMVVVLAIIVLITAVTITGQSSFNKTLLLTDTTYSVAFSAREAQSYGLASRKFGASTNNPGYGLHFDRSMPGSYTFFADVVNTLHPFPTGCPVGTPGTPSEKPGNCRFDAGDGIVNKYTFSRGYTIKQFCGKTGSRQYCSTDSSPLTNMDLVFTRPNTSTMISGQVNGSGSPIAFSCALVVITDSSEEATRFVRISSLGEITVGQNLACP
jgi:prepilin-type N-terminal cleavage/methylation domain-containing protein